MKLSQLLAAAALLAMLTACGSGRERPAPQAPDEAAIATGPNAGLSAAGTVWHLRGALNVAALKCGGEVPDQYNAALKVHARSFARAQTRLQREYRRGGGDWQDRFDDHQTRLYNHAANPRGERAFCAAARPVLREITTVSQRDLPKFAARSLATLDGTLGR